MAYQRTSARTLCTKVEYQLFEASLGKQIEALTPARLQGKIRRARDLRNKYRDLYKRQRLADRARTGSKKGAKPGSNARTEQKAQLYAEVLERFEQRAKQLASARQLQTARVSAKTTLARVKAGKRAKAPARPRAKKKARKTAGTTTFVSEAAHSADRRKLSRDTRSKTLHAHARSAGRRVQARRDNRR